MGVNKRINRILHDPVFTSNLTLMRCLSYDSICSLPDSMLDRFCSEILPKIDHKIKWLNLESSSMKRIFLSGNYANLFGLGIYNIDKENALRLFTDQTSLTHDIFKTQISALVIKTIPKENLTEDVNTRLFTYIFTMFTNLQYLNFNPSFIYYQRISFRNSFPTVFSSTLQVMHVKVLNVDDCLYLLDGRFNQLRTFYVNITSSHSAGSSEIINKEKLLNLRYFSLSCYLKIYFYEEVVIPLLHRMSNLEQLCLYFTCSRNKSFVDGNDLKTNIINHMPRLNKFLFNIRSCIRLHNHIDLSSNEDIQHTFRDFKGNQIMSCVDYFPDANEGHCHVYSYPFTMMRYERITNNFPGGLYTCVREISLFDERPFEHEFFLRIEKSFPLLKDLSLINWKPQKNKKHKTSKNDNQEFSIIKYLHLSSLDLREAHEDYVEQFLFDIKTCMPNNVHLYINYGPLRRVTHNFQRDATRINCAKVNCICMDKNSRLPKHFKDYFLDIDVHL